MTPEHQIQLTMIPLDKDMKVTNILQTIADSTEDKLQIGILHSFDCPQSANLLLEVIIPSS